MLCICVGFRVKILSFCIWLLLQVIIFIKYTHLTLVPIELCRKDSPIENWIGLLVCKVAKLQLTGMRLGVMLL